MIFKEGDDRRGIIATNSNKSLEEAKRAILDYKPTTRPSLSSKEIRLYSNKMLKQVLKKNV